MKHGFNWTVLCQRYGGFRDVYYAGIGSRETPKSILYLQELIGFRMASIGVRLISGGALGSDEAFYRGCREWCLKQPEVPSDAASIWIRARDRQSVEKQHLPIHIREFEQSVNVVAAREIASTIHPNWSAVLKLNVEDLHARNCYQILTESLQRPVNQVVLYAKPVGNSVKGGTRTAFELARHHNVDIVNLHFPEARARAFRFLGITEEFFNTINPN